LAAALALCAGLAALPAGASPVLDSVPTLENVSKRLELTPAQETQLRPIFEERLAALQKTQSDLQQAATDKEKREVLRAAKRAGDAFNTRVTAVLSSAQRHEWNEIRAAAREKAKARIDQKRAE